MKLLSELFLQEIQDAVLKNVEMKRGLAVKFVYSRQLLQRMNLQQIDFYDQSQKAFLKCITYWWNHGGMRARQNVKWQLKNSHKSINFRVHFMDDVWQTKFLIQLAVISFYINYLYFVTK